MRAVKAKQGQSLTPNVVMKRTQSQENEELRNDNSHYQEGVRQTITLLFSLRSLTLDLI